MMRPVRPMGPVIWAFGAKAPIARPTKRTAPTPRGEAADTDLANEVAKADREKCRQDRLAADDIARNIQHDFLPDRIFYSCLAGSTACVAELLKYPVHQMLRGRLGVGELVF